MRILLTSALVGALALMTSACDFDVNADGIDGIAWACSSEDDCLGGYTCMGMGPNGELVGRCIQVPPEGANDCTDADGDGFFARTENCPVPEEFIDCDDTNREVYPGAPEECNGLDNNCNGVADCVTAEDGTCIEPIPPRPCPLNAGVCRGLAEACLPDAGEYEGCDVVYERGNPDEGIPGRLSQDICDGFDRNCSGVVDSNSSLPRDQGSVCDCDPETQAVVSCNADLGACSRGVRLCLEDGQFRTACLQAPVTLDDCENDEDCGEGAFCVTETLNPFERPNDGCGVDNRNSPDCTRNVCRALRMSNTCESDVECGDVDNFTCVDGTCRERCTASSGCPLAETCILPEPEESTPAPSTPAGSGEGGSGEGGSGEGGSGEGGSGEGGSGEGGSGEGGSGEGGSGEGGNGEGGSGEGGSGEGGSGEGGSGEGGSGEGGSGEPSNGEPSNGEPSTEPAPEVQGYCTAASPCEGNDDCAASGEQCVLGYCQRITVTGTAETCNGFDDSCDGNVDFTLGTAGGRFGVCGPCNHNQVRFQLELPGGRRDFLCVDKFEASRPDATASDAGSNNLHSTSRRDVLPWTNIAPQEAEDACRAVAYNAQYRTGTTGTVSALPNRFVCSASQWAQACGGLQGSLDQRDFTYGWDQDACEETVNPCADGGPCVRGVCQRFEPGRCGDGTHDSPGVRTTGSYDDCYRLVTDPASLPAQPNFRIYDMSGNVAEWVALPTLRAFGGSWLSSEASQLGCSSFIDEVDDTRFTATGSRYDHIGFRCCSSLNPAP